MNQDTLRYDSLEARPLPKWLTDQRDGRNTWQPEVRVMKEDHALRISLISTGAAILLTILLLTIYFLKKHKRKNT